MATALTVRILLVDDHPVVLDGLEGGLAREADLMVVARAATVAQARSILDRLAIDIVLVDIRLPDGSGLELLAESTGTTDTPAWIVLSSFETPQYLAAALSLGAAGYLLKTAPTAEVVVAIRTAAGGGTAFTAAQLAAARGSGTVFLSAVDRGIVRGVLTGRSNDEIASQVGLSTRTIEAHLTRLYARVGVASRTELALRADREGWLDLP